MTRKMANSLAGTFILNKDKPIHRWYSYLEGYSSCFVDEIIKQIGAKKIKTIYDPFCGTGTTSLVASSYGIPSYYCETNPFMQQVIEAKINSVQQLREQKIGGRYLEKFLCNLKRRKFDHKQKADIWGGFEKFFDSEVLNILQALRQEIENIEDPHTRNIAMVLLASETVRASKMIRQGDLRWARQGEKDTNDKDILANFICKLEIAIHDISSEETPTKAATVMLSSDARDINTKNKVDCIITSPPYLNGTNYIRNTKLELKLTGYLEQESDLPKFHSKGIIAGINNVSKRKLPCETLDVVCPYIKKLVPVSYDSRIPRMVEGYFYDMDVVLSRIAKILHKQGLFVMDIGDSQFAGVHIPTHKILSDICESKGLQLIKEDVLRKRISKNGMTLSQRLLWFKQTNKFK